MHACCDCGTKLYGYTKAKRCKPCNGASRKGTFKHSDETKARISAHKKKPEMLLSCKECGTRVSKRTKSYLCYTCSRRKHGYERNFKGSWQHLSRKHKKTMNYTCQITHEQCKQSDLHVHHIDSVVTRPDLAIDINNLIVIKRSIHQRFHELYGRRTTRNDWNDYVSKLHTVVKDTA